MAWEIVSSNFHANTEIFYTHDTMRHRPVAVRGFISGPSQGKTRTVSAALATIGISGGVDGKIPNTEAGHLIALELGGADSSHNLVPMYGGVNRGTYRALETTIGKRITGAKKPAIYVEVAYPALKIVDPDDSRIPTHMNVYFFADGGDLSQLGPASLNLVGRIPNTKQEPVRMAIEGGDIELRRKLIEIKSAFPGKKWKVESVLGDFKGNLPAVDKRPNAWLDYLVYSEDTILTAKALLSKVPGGEFTVGPGWDFASQQRVFVALANCMTQLDERKGEVWSDMGDADPIQTALTPLGTDDGIQIDHIHPKASGGPNIYSNAAVTSALFNKQKGR